MELMTPTWIPATIGVALSGKNNFAVSEIPTRRTTKYHCASELDVFRGVSRVNWLVGLVVHYFIHLERAK